MSQQLDLFETGVVKALPMLRRVAVGLCRNQDRADDLTQEACVRALKNRHLFTEGTNLDAWLVMILKNYFLSDLRKRKREVEDADGLIAGKIAVEDSPLRKIEAREALDLVNKLPLHWREPLRLLADGAQYDEVALETCQQVGTVKSKVHRAREILRAAEGRSGQ